jgi:hypothetical protein
MSIEGKLPPCAGVFFTYFHNNTHKINSPLLDIRKNNCTFASPFQGVENN